MTPPIAIELFAGLFGWGEGLVAEGFITLGFDIVDMHSELGIPRVPGTNLVRQDVLSIDGRQFKNAALIVASPPCQEFSYMAMPWSKAKQKARDYRGGTLDTKDLTALFDACFRIQREACEAAGRHIPMVVENVRGAQEWVGRSRWNFGSFHLWGDVPALMPRAANAVKVGGLDWNGFKNGDPDYKGQAFNTITATRERRALRQDGDGLKIGGDWFSDPQSTCRRHSSKSQARKRASAMIAKIPLALSSHIARVYHPRQIDAA